MNNFELYLKVKEELSKRGYLISTYEEIGSIEILIVSKGEYIITIDPNKYDDALEILVELPNDFNYELIDTKKYKHYKWVIKYIESL